MIHQLVKIQLFLKFMYFDIFISKLDCIFHRIIGQFRSEGTPGGLWSHVLPEAGSAMGSHQVAQGLTSQLLKTCKDRDITTSLGNGENVFPYIQSESLLFQFLPVVSCPPAVHHCEKSGSSWWPPHTYWGASRPLITPQSCLFSQTEQAPILHLLLTGQVQPHRQPLTVLVATRWTHPSLKHWEIFRQKIPSPNILLSAKKKSQKFFVLFLKYVYFLFQLDQNSLSHRLLFQTHHKFPNPALFVQL